MIVGFMILVTAFAAWRWRREKWLLVWSATPAPLLLPLQVLLGGLTVTRSL